MAWVTIGKLVLLAILLPHFVMGLAGLLKHPNSMDELVSFLIRDGGWSFHEADIEAYATRMRGVELELKEIGPPLECSCYVRVGDSNNVDLTVALRQLL